MNVSPAPHLTSHEVVDSWARSPAMQNMVWRVLKRLASALRWVAMRIPAGAKRYESIP